MAEKFSALTTTLKRNGTEIASVRSISGPNLTLDTVDSTTYNATGGYGTLVATVLRAGDVTFEILFDPVENTHDEGAGLLADMVAKTLQTFTITFADTASTVWTFTAYVTAFSPGSDHAGLQTASVTLSISGDPTLA